MKKYPNIQGRKVQGWGYPGFSADGRLWRIRGRFGHWSATADCVRVGSTNMLIGFDRLSEISHELAQIK